LAVTELGSEYDLVNLVVDCVCHDSVSFVGGTPHKRSPNCTNCGDDLFADTAHQRAEEAISLAKQIQSTRLAADLQVLLQTMPPENSRDDQDLHHRLSAILTEIT
jgi:hypothetical protein